MTTSLPIELLKRGYTQRRFPDGKGRIHAWLPPLAFQQRVVGEWHVGNLGAGVQSTDVYLRTQAVDVWIFADTMDEKEETYHHLLWLIDRKQTPIMVASRGKLSADLKRGMNSTGQRFASIPVFTAPDKMNWVGDQAKEGQLQRQCTKEYKVEVIEAVIKRVLLGLTYRKRNPHTTVVHQYFGISIDEKGRATKIFERSLQRKFTAHFTLLEEDRDREDCIRSLRVLVPHEVPKSACIHCPFQDDWSWRRMKEDDPDEFEEACQIDEALRKPGVILNRKVNQAMYLHRSCRSLREIDFSQASPPPPKLKQHALLNLWGTQHECEGVCGI